MLQIRSKDVCITDPKSMTGMSSTVEYFIFIEFTIDSRSLLEIILNLSNEGMLGNLADSVLDATVQGCIFCCNTSILLRK